MQKAKFEKDFLFSFKQKDKDKLEMKIAKIYPNIKEVNLISEEFKRKIKFNLQMTYFYIDMDTVQNYENEKK